MARTRNVQRRLFCGALLVCLATSARANPLDEGSTLCLLPPAIPAEEGDPRRTDLEQLLRNALEAASYNVPNPKDVADLSDEIRESAGELYDTISGYRNEDRHQALLKRRADALRSHFGCDALVAPHVVVVRARYDSGTASWDGTKEQVISTGRIILAALGGATEHGWVSALSLWLFVRDPDGNDIAFRSAGIEALVNFAVLREQDILPRDQWLTDRVKMSKAIESALGPNGDHLRRTSVPKSADNPDDGESEIPSMDRTFAPGEKEWLEQNQRDPYDPSRGRR